MEIENNFKNIFNWENFWYNYEYENHITRDKNQLNKYGCDSFVDWYKWLYFKIDSVKFINKNRSSSFYVNCFNSEINFIKLINYNSEVNASHHLENNWTQETKFNDEY